MGSRDFSEDARVKIPALIHLTHLRDYLLPLLLNGQVTFAEE
ncbi:MAG: hypothetical protein SOZ01_06405 [Selenomonadaceae bacterium]|jgi:hypothetical protein|nr:hypothetical protein [Selenomonadaceae bacterium]MDY3916355.1 hypothetical protein [Selenomonadaceae bacterium]